MLGREANAFANYRSKTIGTTEDIEKIKDHWKTMKRNIYPLINEYVTERESQRAEAENQRRLIVNPFPIGSYVMAKDVTRGSGWNDKFLGPFRVTHQNQNGSYKLENPMRQEEPYRFPPEHLIPVEGYEFPEDVSSEIKRILDIRGQFPEEEYLVEFKDDKLENYWITREDFDSKATLLKFFKERHSKQLQQELEQAGIPEALASDWSTKEGNNPPSPKRKRAEASDYMPTGINKDLDTFMENAKRSAITTYPDRPGSLLEGRGVKEPVLPIKGPTTKGIPLDLLPIQKIATTPRKDLSGLPLPPRSSTRVATGGSGLKASKGIGL